MKAPQIQKEDHKYLSHSSASQCVQRAGGYMMRCLICPTLVIIRLLVIVISFLFCPIKAVVAMIYGTPENQIFAKGTVYKRCLSLHRAANTMHLSFLAKKIETGIWFRSGWYIYDPYFDVEKGERRALHNSYGEDQEEDEADLFSDD
eukprot:jgi/Bigna1/141527/aug1.63_g16235